MRDAPIQPIPLPSLSQHLREFASRRDAWLILARNLVPVVGVYAFHWSATLTVFNYWFDGLAALAAIIAALTPRALRESLRPAKGFSGKLNRVLGGVVVWAFLCGVVGLPYWFVLIALHEVLLSHSLYLQLAHSSGLLLTFALIAATHFWKAFHVGYDAMPEPELKQRYAGTCICYCCAAWPCSSWRMA